LNWIGKEAVVGHHKKMPFRLLKCSEKMSAAKDWSSIDVAFRRSPEKGESEQRKNR
jgi:hypothetical protein